MHRTKEYGALRLACLLDATRPSHLLPSALGLVLNVKQLTAFHCLRQPAYQMLPFYGPASALINIAYS